MHRKYNKMNVITIIVMNIIKELINLFTYVKIWINDGQKCEDALNDSKRGEVCRTPQSSAGTELVANTSRHF